MDYLKEIEQLKNSLLEKELQINSLKSSYESQISELKDKLEFKTDVNSQKLQNELQQFTDLISFSSIVSKGDLHGNIT